MLDPSLANAKISRTLDEDTIVEIVGFLRFEEGPALAEACSFRSLH